MSERDTLLTALAGGDRTAEEALLARPDWLAGPPPPALLSALRALEYETQTGLFAVAREWERAPLGHALLSAFHESHDDEERQRLAWLLKSFAAPDDAGALTQLAMDETLPLQLRIYFVQALDWLAFQQQLD